MPGRSRDTHPWPFFGLRITTPRLELRMPDDEDLAELFEAARAGIHPADEMPFGVPWTDGLSEPDGAGQFLAYHWTARGALSPESWALNFAVVADGRVVGIQELMVAGLRRQPQRDQRLLADRLRPGTRDRRRDARRRAPPRLRRARRARGATSAWVDNAASQRVSPARSATSPTASCLMARRGEPTRHLRYRLTREAWQRNHFDGIEIHDLEPCLALLGAA